MKSPQEEFVIISRQTKTTYPFTGTLDECIAYKKTLPKYYNWIIKCKSEFE